MNYLIQPSSKVAAAGCCEKISTSQNNHNCQSRKNESGFSLVELLIVITIISVMSAVTIFSYFGNRKAYRTEDQALRVMDFMREAKQNALSQRQVMRLEIDLDDKVLRIIDEETPDGNSNDSHTNDRIIKQENLDNSGSVRVDVRPSNITVLPNVTTTTTPASNYPVAVYAASAHPLSAGHNVWAVRFQSNGSVTGPDAAGAVPSSATLFVWQPDGNTNYALPAESVRAVTLFGGAGTTKYWQYDGNNFVGR